MKTLLNIEKELKETKKKIVLPSEVKEYFQEGYKSEKLMEDLINKIESNIMDTLNCLMPNHLNINEAKTTKEELDFTEKKALEYIFKELAFLKEIINDGLEYDLDYKTSFDSFNDFVIFVENKRVESLEILELKYKWNRIDISYFTNKKNTYSKYQMEGFILLNGGFIECYTPPVDFKRESRFVFWLPEKEKMDKILKEFCEKGHI